MRLAIGKAEKDGRLEIVKTVRAPVRLGWDVFAHGRLSNRIIDRAVDAFREFSDLIRRSEASQTAAIATSAVREAGNGRLFTEKIRRETGIGVRVISGLEEARLMHLAVSWKLDIGTGDAMLVDIGGGSVELALTSNGRLMDSRSCGLGTVRMLHVLSDRRLGRDRFDELVKDVADDASAWVREVLGRAALDVFIGTGGNVEAIGDLSGRRVGKRATSYAHVSDIDRTLSALEALGLDGRRRELRLKDDRADVIYPAAVVLQALMNAVRAASLTIPRVGLREGLLIDTAARRTQTPPPADRPRQKQPIPV